MMTSLDSTPLRLPPPARDWKQTIWVLLSSLMFGAMLVAATIYTAPTLVSDWQVREAARPVAEAEVTDGKCSSQLIVHICNATLSVETPSGSVSRRVNYVFTGVHVGEYTIDVLADPARPDLVTTDLALNQLWNRTFTLAALVVALLGATMLPLVALIRNRRSIAGHV